MVKNIFYHYTDVIKDIKKDLDEMLSKSIKINKDKLKTNLITRFIRAIVRIFAPML